MAKNTQKTNLAVNAEGDALATLLNNGFIDILDGTQPASGDTAISTQVLLGSLQFGNPAFGSTVAGVATANAITSGTAVATSTATWCRLYKSDHTTAVFDGSVGTSASNLVLNSVAISSGATISCVAFTFTLAKSTAGS